MTISAELERLSVQEKLQLVQDLWDQIAAVPENVPVPEWHRAELAKRTRDLKDCPDPGEDWDIVRKQLREGL